MASMRSEVQKLILSDLAYHLRVARQYSRLRSLFDADTWLHTRFEESGYNYDGYIADLTLAWDAAVEQTDRQIEDGQEPTSIADCFRYALIRTSINSIAETYNPELVAQAVSLELWTPRRALSVAARATVDRLRAKFYTLILGTGKLDQDELDEAQQSGLNAALAVFQSKWSPIKWQSRTEALVDIAPMLSAELLSHALNVVLKLEQEIDRAVALTALIPHLVGMQKHQAVKSALDATRACPLEGFKVEILNVLAPLLPSESIQHAVDTR